MMSFITEAAMDFKLLLIKSVLKNRSFESSNQRKNLIMLGFTPERGIVKRPEIFYPSGDWHGWRLKWPGSGLYERLGGSLLLFAQFARNVEEDYEHQHDLDERNEEERAPEMGQATHRFQGESLYT
jgi:hypothetical protein